MNKSHLAIEHKLQEFHAQKRIPHIIFYGPAASGKKHILMNFLKKIYENETSLHSNVMFVNCAHGKGIKFIRDELKFFAKTNTQWNTGVNFKSIVLLNAEHLTVDAQSAMRRCIEQYSNNARFFIVIHNKSKLLVPILSRFCEIYVPPFLDALRNPISLIQEKYAKDFDLGKMEIAKQNSLDEYLGVLKKDSSTVNHLTLSRVATQLYEEAFCVQDIIAWMKNQLYWTELRKATVGMEYMKVKPEFRCEKLLMLYVLDMLFLESL